MLANKIISRAPGKVLVAGGYGVLEAGNVGLTLALDKYFYSVSSVSTSQDHNPSIRVHVHSPQINKKWHYTFTSSNSIIKEDNNFANSFLQNAIKYSLIYAYQSTLIKVTEIEIILLQDRGFLSEEQSESKYKFIHYSQNSTKTGLGSSAAVIVVTVSAILRQLLMEVSKELINAVSQVANLAAQNKIGSNFDISTAVFGSHLYTNTLPAVAYSVTSTHDFKKLLSIDPQIKKISPVCERVRNGYCCMIDLREGSNTRKMVSGFIKSLNEEAANTISEFFQKSKHYAYQLYSLIIGVQDFSVVRARMGVLNSQYRKFIQTYSSITNTPVEPPQLTPFLDRICSLPNVLYAICPGSGGYDAIFVLTDAQSTLQRQQLKSTLHSVLKQCNLMSSVWDTRIVWSDQGMSNSELSAIAQFLS